MDTQNLAAFVAVARTGSFSHAGEALHLTQPAVSKRISLLEQQLETRLFDRIGRQVSLTEGGRALLPRALEILDSIERSRQAIKDLGEEVQGKLHLVTSHHVGLHRLPDILREYCRRYPKVNLDIQFMDSHQARSNILSGVFDLGIVTQSNENDAQVHSEQVWQDSMVFVAAPSHPLSAKKIVSLKDLSAYPALLPESHFYTTQIVESLFRQNDLPLQVLMSTNYLETIKALISVGYAWGVLPEIMLKDKSVMILPVQGLQLSRQLDCIYHRDRSLSHPARSFVELLRESARNPSLGL